MLKKQYVTPEFELYKVRLEQTILSGNVEKMQEVVGEWEEDE